MFAPLLGEASDVPRSKEERLVIETLRSSGPLNVKVIMQPAWLGTSSI
jgi:hypothetical protein